MQQDRTAIFASKLNSSCIQFLMLGTTALLFGTAWRLEPILLFLQLYQNYRLKPSSKNYYRTHFKRIVNTVITTMQKVSILFTFKWGYPRQKFSPNFQTFKIFRDGQIINSTAFIKFLLLFRLSRLKIPQVFSKPR